MISELDGAGRGFVCGRIARIDSERIVLADESGVAELRLGCCPSSIGEGDIVEVAFKDGRAEAVRLLAKAARPPSGNPDFVRFNEELKAALRLRARITAEIRAFFREEGFLEVETPSLVPSPGLEPHLRSFATHYTPDGNGSGGRRVFLPASPEYHMKRMLAAGSEKIFQICRSYRNGESFDLHNPEFTMLEWYRAYADSAAIMTDLERLGGRLAQGITPRRIIEFRGGRIDFAPPWHTVTVREAFRRWAGIELPPENDAEAFRAAARDAGVANITDDDTWEDVFYKVFLSVIEPKLGTDKPLFLTEYPASMAALARCKESDPTVAERFELFIGGVEIANGFTELNDPAEQRRRFIAEQQHRQQAGAPEHPIDERLLEALSIGMPPSGGVAVGVDRLVMILAGRERIEDVIAFPFSHDFPGAADRE